MAEFLFPFEPYDIQVSLMRTIISCINEGKIGILESPTDEDDWLNAHITKVKAVEDAKELFNELENDKKINERIQKALGNLKVERKRKLLGDKDVEGKNDDETDDILDEDFTNDQLASKVPEEPTPTCTKIIYATRTHSQLLQFAEEIMKTRFQPRVVTLGSRQHLCVNESVRALQKTSLMTERCNELRDIKASEKRQKDDDDKVLFLSFLIII
ncbi:hypothetical protein LOAG_14466 [Loa loa]|uniref:Helicase ATP-binding domain-containing protein n=1 Tax=Loa loa TaxID=7209 RepID=A0A1S0THQ9_LOALO|nr:hypothetical protein LOAG_14466 [Loa loa]EFO14058.2 hypothetical protein LOAG_14466 [Loa loa]